MKRSENKVFKKKRAFNTKTMFAYIEQIKSRKNGLKMRKNRIRYDNMQINYSYQNIAEMTYVLSILSVYGWSFGNPSSSSSSVAIDDKSLMTESELCSFTL